MIDDETYLRLMASYAGMAIARKIMREEVVRPPRPPRTPRASPGKAARFQNSKAWRELSARVRKEQPFCAMCHSAENLHADHIKPKSKYPELALERSNIRTLCRGCNFKKGTKE